MGCTIYEWKRPRTIIFEMGNDPQNERLWYDLILSSLDFMRREISLRFFVASVPKLIIH